MDMKEKDPVLELFDVFRQVMENAVLESENQFQKQVHELAVAMKTTYDEFRLVGFTNEQAFSLTRILLLGGVNKNG